MLRLLSHGIMSIAGLLVGLFLPDSTPTTVKGLFISLEVALIAVYFLIRKNMQTSVDTIKVNLQKFDILSKDILDVQSTINTLESDLQKNTQEISKLEKQKAEITNTIHTVEERTTRDASEFLKNL